MIQSCKMATSVLVLLIVVSTLYPHLVQSQIWEHTVTVDLHAGNDSECVPPESRSPCKTLARAFGYRNDSTLYFLQNGTYRLESNVAPFTNLNNISITGNSSGKVKVLCSNDVGLAFVNVSRVSVANVMFIGCGALRNSTSSILTKSSITREVYSLRQFQVGIYFYLCTSVNVTRVTVSDSNATGMVIYDTDGYVNIEDSVFHNNSVSVDVPFSVAGGGGLYVEFSYCAPGITCNESYTPVSTHNANSVYVFERCNFSRNKASNTNSSRSTFILPQMANHEAFGRGGGLSIFFNHNATNNHMFVTNCNFKDNVALWGGGMFVEFHDSATGNIVLTSDCTFESNCLLKGQLTAGGAFRIGYYVFQRIHALNNISISKCNFTENHAFYGGGVSISPALQPLQAYVPMFFISECTFIANYATIGSAIHISLFDLIPQGSLPDTIIRRCIFKTNYITGLRNAELHQALEVGVGTVYVNNIPVQFEDSVVFENNTGTALAVVGTHIGFTSCKALFKGNRGVRGGAISLLGAAWMLINENTTMTFDANHASIIGGAIHNVYIEIGNAATSSDCFLKYNDPSIPADLWAAHFVFINNSAVRSGQSIYSSTILPCALLTSSPTSMIFCWNETYWNFSGHLCKDQISTDIGNVTIVGPSKTYPGHPFYLNLSITDDLGNNILNQSVFTGVIDSKYRGSSPDPNISIAYDYITNGTVTVYGNEGYYNFSLVMDSAGERPWQVGIEIIMEKCPPGLGLFNNTCTCHVANPYGGAVLCLGAIKCTSTDNDNGVYLKQGYWMGYLDNSSKIGLYVTLCPPGYCNGKMSSLNGYVKLPNSTSGLDVVVCSNYRKGVACRQCQDGYSPAVNSYTYMYECTQCNDSEARINSLKYVGTVYVPLVLLFLIIIFFNIHLTTGPANAFILYSQIISSTFDLTAGGQINYMYPFIPVNTVAKVYKTVYGILNLDFFSNLLDPFCLSTSLETLDLILLNYIVAVFPLVMIILFMVFSSISQCCNCNRILCCKQRPFKTTPLLAFATYLLLSYNKFCITAFESYKSLTQLTLVSEDGTHVPSASETFLLSTKADVLVLAKVLFYLIAILISLLPIFLLGWPVRLMELCMNRVTSLWKHYPADKIGIVLDTFQGCYNDNQRFFASAYFIFRLVLNVEYILCSNWSAQYSLQQITCVVMLLLIAVLQPYKSKLLNYLDIFLISDLIIVNTLSQYMLQDQTPQPLLPYVLQSLMVFIPLVLFAIYFIWSTCEERLKWIAAQFMRKTRYELVESVDIETQPDSST